MKYVKFVILNIQDLFETYKECIKLVWWYCIALTMFNKLYVQNAERSSLSL